jgi:DNA-binding LacI/PurR family transcriptional regulator
MFQYRCACRNPADGRKPRVTIRQVAEMAGVSIATVSRVVNGRSDVSSTTREVVRRVIAEQGYHASPRARPGEQARTGLIGAGRPSLPQPSSSG